jgi:serine/tyrosine/threonine adenylyltransferase
MPVDENYEGRPIITNLSHELYDPVTPATFPVHHLRFRNQRWANSIGLGTLSEQEWEQHFAAFAPLPNNLPNPLALRYHGHQFRIYNPALGDGRGFLFAQLFDKSQQRVFDLGTKGSGRTMWSRGGDGRLTLKGGVREVLATEMLEALGVNTSKTLSLFETGEQLMRSDEPSPTRSSVMVRLNHSHIRFGTFQRVDYHNQKELTKELLEYCVENYYPELKNENDLPLAFLKAVASRMATTCAQWMIAGFVHGVLNTDNMNITGESFDYGPYRFLPTYDPNYTAAYFDEVGMYAYGRQPSSVVWNLSRLAETLHSLSPSTNFAEALREFEPVFGQCADRTMLWRLGLLSANSDQDRMLLGMVFDFLEQSQMPFDQFFFDWFGGHLSKQRAETSPAKHHYQGPLFAQLFAALGRHHPAKPKLLANPYFQQSVPCTLHISRIESVWDSIEQDNWQDFENIISEIRNLGQILSEVPHSAKKPLTSPRPIHFGDTKAYRSVVSVVTKAIAISSARSSSKYLPSSEPF